MVIKTRQMQEIERDDPQRRDIREILRDAYERGGNVVDAGRLLGISGPTFSIWVGDLGGEIRSEVVFSGPVDQPPADLAGAAK